MSSAEEALVPLVSKFIHISDRFLIARATIS